MDERQGDRMIAQAPTPRRIKRGEVSPRAALGRGLSRPDAVLRGADALYAATAQATGSTLVSWDGEPIRRAGAITRTDWLNAAA